MGGAKSQGGKVVVFSLLGLLDLALTARLLHVYPEDVYEGNPVARWWLEQCGWGGVAGFKVALLLLTAGLALVISRSRPQTAGRLLSVACVATALVVTYSGALLGLGPASRQRARLERPAAAEARGRRLDEQARLAREFKQLLDRLSADVAAGRRTPEEAASELAASDRGHDPRWLALLRNGYPAESDAACLAAYLRVAARERQPESSATAVALVPAAGKQEARPTARAPRRPVSWHRGVCRLGPHAHRPPWAAPASGFRRLPAGSASGGPFQLRQGPRVVAAPPLGLANAPSL